MTRGPPLVLLQISTYNLHHVHAHGINVPFTNTDAPGDAIAEDTSQFLTRDAEERRQIENQMAAGDGACHGNTNSDIRDRLCMLSQSSYSRAGTVYPYGGRH